MNTLRIDIETYSTRILGGLKGVGVFKYAECPEFEILIVAYRYNKQPRVVVDLACGEELPAEFWDWLIDPKVLKTAYNAAFEITCLQKYLDRMPGFITLDPSQWRCTMVRAAMLGLPWGLDNVATVLRLPIQKDPIGMKCIKFFSIPCKPTKKNGYRTRNYPIDNLALWDQYLHYCGVDVDTEEAIDKRIDFFELPEFEEPYYALDYQINARGWRIDRNLVNQAMKINEAITSVLFAEVRKITGIQNPNSGQQLIAWMKSRGEHLPSLAKAHVIEYLDNEATDPDVIRVLTIRQHISKSSIGKYKTMIRTACKDDRIRGIFQYYGASGTGRWAGRFVQPQNLPKNLMTSLDMARELVLQGDVDSLEFLFNRVAVVLSQLIRTAFVPRPGYKFYVTDFAAIEARVLAWLANETWRLDVFREGRDIYKESYSRMFHVPLEEVTKEQRQTGKVAELALGYQGAEGALLNMDGIPKFDEDKLIYKDNHKLNPDDLSEIVKKWRAASPRIKNLWYDLNKAAIRCVESKSPQTVGRIKFTMLKNILCMHLPSGRFITYFRPFIGLNRFGSECVMYEGPHPKTGKWTTLELSGGSICNNAVQGTSRDVLVLKMGEIAAECYDIVAHIHDEIVTEIPESNNKAAAKIEAIMSAPISWAPGLPLKGDGFEHRYYKKSD